METTIILAIIYMVYFCTILFSIVVPISLYRKQKYKASTVISTITIVIGLLFNLMYFVTGSTSVAKPIIYLYPEQEQITTVRLINEDIITVSYPKYEDEWKVLVKPNGDLVDLKTGRNLYALYWEGNTKINANIKEGFVVKGEEAANFLEEKLAILGLNEREAEEFIVYWLPQLESNEYNFIRFATQEEINKTMPLEISPIPDTIIRVYMEFKAVNKDYKCIEQVLEKKERNGFTLVEWGGIQL